jgi:hypothetical protein
MSLSSSISIFLNLKLDFLTKLEGLSLGNGFGLLGVNLTYSNHHYHFQLQLGLQVNFVIIIVATSVQP